MKPRQIRSLQVSEIGMGCMGFSHGYGQIPSEEYSINAIRAALDYGCNFLDTAEVYGPELHNPGHNERIIGKAVAGRRQDVVIATKLHLYPDEIENGVTVKDAVKKHLVKSLEYLQTDYVDLYYLHRINANVSYLEIADAMGQLIKEGVIREWGMSQVGVDSLAKANEICPVAAVQNLYSMVERDCEKEIFPYCLKHGITVVPFSPVASGLLSGKISTDTQFEKVDDVRNFVPQLAQKNIIANQPIVELLKRYAELKNATPAQICLAWMLYKYPHVVPIPGSKNKEHILENLGASMVVFSADEFRELEKALEALHIYGHRGHVETDESGFNTWGKES